MSPSTNLICLRFDRANYGPWRVPCQMLPFLFHEAGLNFAIETRSGAPVQVSKKQVQAAMENGLYVWVKDARPVVIYPGSGLCVKLDMSITATSYKPIFEARLSAEELQELTAGAALCRPIRVAAYRYNEDAGVGSNVQKAGA